MCIRDSMWGVGGSGGGIGGGSGRGGGGGGVVDGDGRVFSQELLKVPSPASKGAGGGRRVVPFGGGKGVTSTSPASTPTKRYHP